MAENAVGIDLVANLSGLRSELAKIPDIGGKAAREMTAQLSKEFKAAERAAKQAGDQGRRTKADFDGMGKAAGDAGGKMAKLAGAADLLDPRLGALARGGADVFDVFEVLGGSGAVLGASLGALAIVAAELGAAYYVLTNNAREEARVSAEVQAAREALEPITRSLRDATIDLDVATGQLTETQATNLRASIEAFEQLQATTEGTRARLAELAKDQGSVWTQMVDGVESVIPSWTPLGYAVRAVTTDSEDLRAESSRLNVVLDEARGKTAALVQTRREETAALEANTGATRSNARAKMTEEEQFAADVAELRAKVDAREAARQDAMRAQFSADVQEFALIDEAALARREEAARNAAEARIKIEEDEARRKVQIRQQSEDAVVGILGSTADAAYAISQRIGEDNKEAALAAFYIAQGAAAAQAAVNTVLAASRAMAEVPYPANIAVAAGAAAAGVASEVAILSTPAPPFSDTPGVQSMPMGGMVGLGAGDYFAAARDPEDLRRQVDNVAPAAPSGPTVMLIGRQMYGRQLRDATEWQSPMVQAIAGTTPSGGRR